MGFQSARVVVFELTRRRRGLDACSWALAGVFKNYRSVLEVCGSKCTCKYRRPKRKKGGRNVYRDKHKVYEPLSLACFCLMLLSRCSNPPHTHTHIHIHKHTHTNAFPSFYVARIHCPLLKPTDLPVLPNNDNRGSL